MALSNRVRLTWRIAPMVAVAALGLAACSNGQDPTSEKGTTPPPFTSVAPSIAAAEQATGELEAGSGDSLVADLENSAGQKIGEVTFTEADGHVAVSADVTTLSAGFHGFHIHQGGECDGDFTSAGGHLNIPGNESGHSSGDLTSLLALENGEATLTTATDMVTLEDIENKTIIVHSGPDNFANIPADRYTNREGGQGADATTKSTGDSGSRVACGVIKK
ncbi:superoxide dismutase family protein [Antrihabitans sp. YC2-6]|uniref:superoxide dismutase family protein n=1 Tax=Antrihabitans sp. YC2-6 TaxID=2799498 RepID=UPI0018F6F212|nr:superoxide dismutase family protein [Antrihabitans sp. YC2-6]MBJ8348589.1 superoxide dismutase family protein [Antrihabitans sp. YC2-6]